MDKIKAGFNKIATMFKNLSKGRKIAFSVLSLGLISAIIYLVIFLNTTEYSVLFTEIDSNDAPTIIAELNERKIPFMVENDTIKVPEENVSELRLELAPQLTSGSKGYKLLEDTSAFGMTDSERNLKYKMALEGELAKTIQSFPEVKQATVFLVMQEDSNFFRPSEPSQASVKMELKPGKNITKEQTKAIISLLTGSVKNLQKEDVKIVGIINGKTTDLALDLFDDENIDMGTATEQQQKHERDLEKEYERKILTLLSPIYGEGVKTTVDVDANFDASQKNTITYDPNSVVLSEEIEKDTNTTTDNGNSAAPVDNNMGNEIVNGNKQAGNGIC